MKDILKMSVIALIISLSTIGAYSHIGGGDISNWAEPPSGEVKGGKFMNLLNSMLVVDEAQWNNIGVLETSVKVKKASDADQITDDKGTIDDADDELVATIDQDNDNSSIVGLNISKIATGSYDIDATYDITTASLYANDADFTSIEENGVAVLNQTESDARYLLNQANSVGNTVLVDNPTFTTVTVSTTTPTSDNHVATKAYVDANSGSDDTLATVTARGNTTNTGITSTNYIKGSQLCIGGDCRSAWPSGGISSCSTLTLDASATYCDARCAQIGAFCTGVDYSGTYGLTCDHVSSPAHYHLVKCRCCK